MALLQASTFFPLLRCSRPLTTNAPMLLHAAGRSDNVKSKPWNLNKFSGQVIFVQTRFIKKDRSTIHTPVPRKSFAEFRKDNVPAGFEFVYASPYMGTYLYLIPGFLFSFLVLCVVMLMSACQVANMQQFRRNSHIFLIPVLLVFCYMKGFKSHPIRLYYNKSTNEFYAFVMRHGLKKYYLQFTPSEVEHLSNNLAGNICVQGHIMRLSENGFLNMDSYNLLMSYSADTKLNKQDAAELFEMKYRERRERARQRMKNNK